MPFVKEWQYKCMSLLEDNFVYFLIRFILIAFSQFACFE